MAIALPGVAGVAHTLGWTLKADPETASRWAPWDGRVTALLAQRRSSADASAADRSSGSILSRRALRQDSTTVVAASTLAINIGLRGDEAGARRLFAYAQRLSRRDLQTQLWAVEDAVAHGNVAGALRHYDIALRTNKNAADLMFPVLGTAIGSPEVRAALVRTLIQRPVWGPFFVNYVAGNGPDPQATKALFENLRHAGIAVAPEPSAVLVSALILAGRWDDAWSYYAGFRPGVDRRRSRDPRFLRDAALPFPFDWTPVNDGGITTSVQTGPNGGVFDFAVAASVAGGLLSQIQLLPQGSYRLSGHSTGIDQPASSLPFWVLKCRHDERELGRVVVPNSALNGGAFSGSFTVPADCPVQLLVLTAAPSDTVGGLTGQIDRVQLAPGK